MSRELIVFSVPHSLKMTSQHLSSNLIEIESPYSQSQLQFQEFPVQDSNSAAKLEINSHTLTFNHAADTPGASSDGTLPGNSYNDTDNLTSLSIWSLEYYQKLFDVNTDQVLERIVWAMFPKPGVNYLQHHIQSKPDLYGPFWICITLVFTIAISGNLANYLQTAASGSYHWKYDFHAVTFSATAIFAYAWLLPSILWGILKWQGSQQVNVKNNYIILYYRSLLYIYSTEDSHLQLNHFFFLSLESRIFIWNTFIQTYFYHKQFGPFLKFQYFKIF